MSPTFHVRLGAGVSTTGVGGWFVAVAVVKLQLTSAASALPARSSDAARTALDRRRVARAGLQVRGRDRASPSGSRETPLPRAGLSGPAGRG